MEVARWGGHLFEVSPEVIRSFDKLTIKSGSDTDDKMQGKQKYLTRKNGKAIEVSLTANLNAFTGSDVRSDAMAFVDEAQNGITDWIYVGGEKLVPCQLMLTDASVEEIAIAPSGVWTRANVKLTFKQSDLGDESIKKKPSGGSKDSPFIEGFWEGVDEALKNSQLPSDQPQTAKEYLTQKQSALSKAISEQQAAKRKGIKGVMAVGDAKIHYKE